MLARPLGALALVACLTPLAASAQVLPVALVVEEVDTAPDTEVNVIVRTVAAQPLAGATLAIEARERDGLPVRGLASLVSATAFAGDDDAVLVATFDHDAQRTEVEITSASGTLNAAFGPLVVLRYALEPGLADDTRFDVGIDPQVELVAPDLSPVPALVEGRGRLRVRIPDPGPAEAGLGALGGPAFPGAPAVFGVATAEPFAIGSGTIELLYDPSFADGAPVVTIDSRYGAAVVDTVTEVEPGHLLISFTATGEDLNATLHGLFLTVSVPSRSDVPAPVSFLLGLGAATTLAAPDGTPLIVEADADTLDFEQPNFVFRGMFEEALLVEWWP